LFSADLAGDRSQCSAKEKREMRSRKRMQLVIAKGIARRGKIPVPREEGRAADNEIEKGKRRNQ